MFWCWMDIARFTDFYVHQIKVAPDININLVQAQTLADFEIGLVKLSQQKTTIGKTTLFPEIYKQYYQLRDEIHSLRLYLFDPPTVDLPQIIKLNGKKIQGDRSQDGPRAWRAYIYHMWGSPPATLRYASPPPFSQAPAIDSNELSTALKLLPSSLHAEILDTGYASPEEPDRGYQSDGGNATLGPRPKFASENVASEMPFPTLTQRRVRIGPGAPEVVQSVNPQPTAPVEPYPSATIGLLGPRPMPSNTNQTFLVRATVRLRPTETKIPDTPVEEKEPNGPVEDRKQEVAEQDTRQMYQTSTQQKPSKKAKKLVTAREPAPYQAAMSVWRNPVKLQLLTVF